MNGGLGERITVERARLAERATRLATDAQALADGLGSWCDLVRQDTELRLGLSRATDHQIGELLADTAYGEALDRFADAGATLAAALRVAGELRREQVPDARERQDT